MTQHCHKWPTGRRRGPDEPARLAAVSCRILDRNSEKISTAISFLPRKGIPCSRPGNRGIVLVETVSGGAGGGRPWGEKHEQ